MNTFLWLPVMMLATPTTPSIPVYLNEELISDVLYIDTNVHLKVENDSQVWIDQTFVTLDEDGSFEVSMDAKQIEIVRQDHIRTITINPALPTCTLDADITIDPNMNIQCTGEFLDQWQLIVEHEGKIETYPAQSFTYVCKEAGKYTVYLQWQNKKIQAKTWEYIDHAPQLSMQANPDTNHTLVTLDWEDTHLVSKHLYLYEGDTKTELPFEKSLYLYGKPNETITYALEGVIEDRAGQVSRYTLPVTIDRRLPIQEVKPTIVSMEPKVEMPIEEKKMEPVPEKSVETIVSNSVLPNLSVQTRQWIKDEKDNIQLEQKVISQPKSKFQILRMRKQNIRIVLNPDDQVVWVRINGKKRKQTKMKQDALHRPYMEMKVPAKKIRVEVLVQDEQGKLKRYKKMVYPLKKVVKKRYTWWESFWMKWFHG